MTAHRVLVCGAGPVGLTAALALARRGVPVSVLESHPGLNTVSQASTFHGSTVELLDDLGVAWELIDRARIVQRLQYRDRRAGLIAEFDFAELRDLTRFPIRLQVEQSQLTPILLERLRSRHPEVDVQFGATVQDVRTAAGGAVVVADHEGREQEHEAALVVGADGAHSAVRRSLGIEFRGEVYPTRHLMITIAYDVLAKMPELAPVTYVFDEDESIAVLTLRDFWRIVFIIPGDEPEERTLDPEHLQARLRAFLPPEPDPYPVLDARVATVHARVADTYRDGPVLLAGDAAHLNHPLGGMGLNSGIHDSVALADAVSQVWHGTAGAEALDEYATRRRHVTVTQVMDRADQAVRDSANAGGSGDRHRQLAAIAADPAAARRWMVEASLFDSMPGRGAVASGDR